MLSTSTCLVGKRKMVSDLNNSQPHLARDILGGVHSPGQLRVEPYRTEDKRREVPDYENQSCGSICSG
jgi:hypothetical protein